MTPWASSLRFFWGMEEYKITRNRKRTELKILFDLTIIVSGIALQLYGPVGHIGIPFDDHHGLYTSIRYQIYYWGIMMTFGRFIYSTQGIQVPVTYITGYDLSVITPLFFVSLFLGVLHVLNYSLHSKKLYREGISWIVLILLIMMQFILPNALLQNSVIDPEVVTSLPFIPNLIPAIVISIGLVMKNIYKRKWNFARLKSIRLPSIRSDRIIE